METRDYLNEAFAEVVRERRERLGVSQETLSERAVLNRRFIGQIEQGMRNPRLESVFRIAGAFEIPPEELVRETREAWERLSAQAKR